MFIENVWNLWKREIKSYLVTPMVYVFVGLFSLLMGILFAAFLREYLRYTMEAQFGGGQGLTIDRLSEAFYFQMYVVLMFILPFLTMRLMTEESRQNTIVLLMTSPIRVWELVIAKFKAAATVLLVMMAMTLIVPFFLIFYSTPGAGPDVMNMLASYVGLYLSGLLFVAVGLMYSSITESQLVAVMCTWATNFGLWMVGIFASDDNWYGKLAKQMAVAKHMEALLKGSVEVNALVFFVSAIFFALFLTHRSIDSRSWRS